MSKKSAIASFEQGLQKAGIPYKKVKRGDWEDITERFLNNWTEDEFRTRLNDLIEQALSLSPLDYETVRLIVEEACNKMLTPEQWEEHGH